MQLHLIRPWDGKPITDEGAYELKATDYHGDPVADISFSSSIGKKLIAESPRHAWHAHPRLNPDQQQLHAKKFDLGTASHALLLRNGSNFVVMDYDNYQTKAAQQEKASAYLARKTPLLTDEYEQVRDVVRATRAQLAAHEDARDAFAEGEGTPEVTLVWRDEGVWCRCRLDWLPHSGRVVYDYKTSGVSVNPETFGRTMLNLGYDFQCAVYRRAIRAVLGIADPAFEFVCQEIKPPYALSVLGMPPSIVEIADRKVTEALRIWKTCLQRNQWPGYPSRTAYIDPPPWYEASWLNRETRQAMENTAGPDGMFARLIDWQAPSGARQ